MVSLGRVWLIGSVDIRWWAKGFTRLDVGVCAQQSQEPKAQGATQLAVREVEDTEGRKFPLQATLVPAFRFCSVNPGKIPQAYRRGRARGVQG